MNDQITPRDYFAGLAMQAFMSKANEADAEAICAKAKLNGWTAGDQLCALAFELADKMMIARNRTP